jgi:thioesterase domain-containing protein
MGGMVAQELAALLAPRGRLVSLGLLATCRGPLGPVPAAAAPLLSARWIAPLVRLLFFTDKDRSQFAKLTILKLFTHAFLEARHPRSGARMRDVRL